MVRQGKSSQMRVQSLWLQRFWGVTGWHQKKQARSMEQGTGRRPLSEPIETAVIISELCPPLARNCQQPPRLTAF